MVTTDPQPTLRLLIGKKADAKTQIIKVNEFVDVMGWKAAGIRLIDKKNATMEWVVKENKNGEAQTSLF